MKSFIAVLIFISALTSCKSMQNKVGSDGYPDIWWKEVPKAQLAGWEISPSEADRSKHEVILSKRNELGQFSNFNYDPFELDGDQYASIEGLWQSMKFPEGPDDERLKDKSIVWPFTRAQVAQMSSFEAKHAGDIGGENMKKLGIKWITYKGQKLDYHGADQDKHYDIILRATKAKLAAHPEIKELLMKTKGLKFFPDHHQGPHDPPAYHYFDIYMKLRDEN
ncbi:MAG: NADAR family protein [Pseudobdellovibrio sp.]